MAEEQQNNQEELFNVDLNFFDEASQFLLDRQEEETVPPAEEQETPPVENTKEENTEEYTEKTGNTESEEQENQDENENQEPSSEDTKEDSSRLTPYFKLLKEEGLFDSSDEEKWDGTTEGFVELENQKFNQWKEQYKSEALHPKVKWLQDNLEEGVPLEQLLQIDKEQTSLENIQEEQLKENTELQKQIARQYYKETTKFSDERINRELERLEASGDLETESPSFFKELNEIVETKKAQTLQEVRQAREQAEKEQQETLQTFKSNLDKTEEIIPGLRLNSVMREKIFDTLTKPVEVDQNGVPVNKIAKARSENPLDFEMKLAYLFELTQGFSDWSPLGSSGKKKAYQDFEKAARELDTQGTKSKQNYRSPNEGSGDFLKELERMQNKGII